MSHDKHLIEACVLEVWLCKEGTVKRLNGGLKEYRDEIQVQSFNSIDIGIPTERSEGLEGRKVFSNNYTQYKWYQQVLCITRYNGV